MKYHSKCILRLALAGLIFCLVQGCSNNGTKPNQPPSVAVTTGPMGSVSANVASFTWKGTDSDGAVSGYYYALDNSSPDTWTTDTACIFTGISNGSHSFYVKAKDNKGAYSPIASRSFSVTLSSLEGYRDTTALDGKASFHSQLLDQDFVITTQDTFGLVLKDIQVNFYTDGDVVIITAIDPGGNYCPGAYLGSVGQLSPTGSGQAIPINLILELISVISAPFNVMTIMSDPPSWSSDHIIHLPGIVYWGRASFETVGAISGIVGGVAGVIPEPITTVIGVALMGVDFGIRIAGHLGFPTNTVCDWYYIPFMNLVFCIPVLGDTVPPAAITSLATDHQTSNSITLIWTAPGDDGNTGTASQYDIRYSTSTITESNWHSATQCSNEPTPKSAGSSESFTVTGLNSNTTYYFATKTADEVLNWSGLSNVPSGKTSSEGDTTPPTSVTNLATSDPTSSSIKLTWTAPGDDGNSGTATQYDIRYSTSTINGSNWISATQCSGEPSPKSAGTSESFIVTELTSNTTYYFALKTADEVPNWSGLSNVNSGKTSPSGSTWTTYNTSNSGLVHDEVRSIVIETSGTMWFGTSGGVSRFDGANWTTYNTSNSGLTDDIVNITAINGSGVKWFGTWNGGVSKFDGTNWITYNSSNSGLADNTVTSIAIDASGDMWFGTYGHGVSRFDGTNWTTYNESNSGLAHDIVEAIAIDASENMWFGTSGGGVSKFDGTNWTTYNTSNSGIANNYVVSIAIDDLDRMWFGTWNGVGTGGDLSKFDGTNWTTYNNSNSGLPWETVFAIAFDGLDQWFGTWGGGVSRLHGSTWTTFDSSNSGLASNLVWTIAIDTSGDIWFGTYDGVSKFHE